jgi:hypothetical protein
MRPVPSRGLLSAGFLRVHSILGNLFFLLYINDLPNGTELAECLLFADDTSIFLSHTDQDYLISTMNAELEKINVWMKTNKLSVNISKTNYIISDQNKSQSR